jgi:hypothetical protein
MSKSVLAEYKVLQRKAFELKDKESKEYLEVSQRMDELWYRLTTEEEKETHRYWQELIVKENT